MSEMTRRGLRELPPQWEITRKTAQDARRILRRALCYKTGSETTEKAATEK